MQAPAAQNPPSVGGQNGGQSARNPETPIIPAPEPETENPEPVIDPPVEEPSYQEPVQDEEEEGNGGGLYITRTGKKYHYDPNCNGGTYFSATWDQVRARGLKPCQKCVG